MTEDILKLFPRKSSGPRPGIEDIYCPFSETNIGKSRDDEEEAEKLKNATATKHHA